MFNLFPAPEEGYCVSTLLKMFTKTTNTVELITDHLKIAIDQSRCKPR